MIYKHVILYRITKSISDTYMYMIGESPSEHNK